MAWVRYTFTLIDPRANFGLVATAEMDAVAHRAVSRVFVVPPTGPLLMQTDEVWFDPGNDAAPSARIGAVEFTRPSGDGKGSLGIVGSLRPLSDSSLLLRPHRLLAPDADLTEVAVDAAFSPSGGSIETLSHSVARFPEGSAPEAHRLSGEAGGPRRDRVGRYTGRARVGGTPFPFSGWGEWSEQRGDWDWSRLRRWDRFRAGAGDAILALDRARTSAGTAYDGCLATAAGLEAIRNAEIELHGETEARGPEGMLLGAVAASGAEFVVQGRARVDLPIVVDRGGARALERAVLFDFHGRAGRGAGWCWFLRPLERGPVNLGVEGLF